MSNFPVKKLLFLCLFRGGRSLSLEIYSGGCKAFEVEMSSGWQEERKVSEIELKEV